ncbi:acylase precursor [Dinoroseobacter shibae DFL 12 = DSM 16493]|jgi:penicillin amidase|uniref:Acylase n=1 Tax=Dinoroseobacter shibae (strain DSM 16493 / NCIMB 14021 / DFL 12) TaxID=398580 RepID=A8LKU3_DINSH|nr:penicillin acylase family protein [Dinoroseobacter shibae]ABV93307.1 acylase precursor [Dinoroseobacter shibae DFL 12 = DSM 16493]URF48226.1 penicillin acylase family protein [Dinoroseobacter shibae]URF52536.1 penicillin acylase family protein [Dinoroseobacter shibae]
MGRILKWMFRLFVGALISLGVALVLVYYFASRSIPDYDGSYALAGVSAPVEIVRDTHNIPHIFGQTDADSFFGLGFVHAQDRLWQMLMFRRTAQGRLSELFGARTLQIDDLLRRFDFYRLAQASIDDLRPETQAALEAYAAGVNAWIAEVNKGALGRGAPEFFLFEPEIAPWQPADSVVLIKLMALQLSWHLQTEVLRARISLALPPERVRDILPEAPGTGLIDLPEYAALVPGIDRRQAFAGGPLPLDPLSPVGPRALAGASNAWAAAPSRSAAGGTLLANDPHLEFTAPSQWYLARLDLGAGGVIGGTVPGIPAVLTGRNAFLGWGLTSSYADDQDLVIEQLNPDNPGEYLTPDGFKPFESRRTVIEVADAAPVTITLRWTENGPVIPRTHYNLGAVTPEGHVAALKWTALSDADTSMDAAIALMAARNVDEGIKAGRSFVAPAQNLTLADRERIAFQTVGALPRRAAAHQSLGRLPAPGWRVQNRWQGTLGFVANPQVIDPPGGLLGNTNNKVIDRPFPLHMSFDWGDTQRIQRWERLMSARQVHTRESFIEAQLDTVSQGARVLLPLVARELWFSEEAAPEGSEAALRRRALDLLAEWNGEMSEHLPEPLIYTAWMRALQERLIRDELGPLADEFDRPQVLFLERVFRDVDGAAVWCDVVQTSAVEDCTLQARRALDDALLELTERFGSAVEGWRWGDAHQATHDHPVLGDAPFLGPIVNLRQSTSGGDTTLMRGLTAGTGANPYRNTHGGGYRGVYDFADPDSSVFIISTGQSGHPLSRHYDDLGELWRRGEYIPMTLDPELARAGANGVTLLYPDLAVARP